MTSYQFGHPDWDSSGKDARPHAAPPPQRNTDYHAKMKRHVQGELFDPAPYRRPEYPKWEGLPAGWTVGAALDRLQEDWEHGALTKTQRAIVAFGLMLTDLVLRKNVRYGNSALEPIAVFARDLTPQQRMAVRMDDKVNRIVRGAGTYSDDGENPVVDLAGYLLLSMVGEFLGTEE